MKKLRAGVIGVGQMGQHHARIYSSLSEVELVGVSDIDEHRAKEVAGRYGTCPYKDHEELLKKGLDALSVSVSTTNHYGIAMKAIECGINVLVEKPLTLSMTEADDLIKNANKKGVVLQVGHIERYNPALTAAKGIIKDPAYIEAFRHGPYTPRMAEVGVVLDLMIHDIDIILFLTGSTVESIRAIGARVLSPTEDLATAHVYFKNGCMAVISASRLSEKRERKMRVFQKDACIFMDYVERAVRVYRKPDMSDTGRNESCIIKEKMDTLKKEPLMEEIKDFIKCIKSGVAPDVSGEVGRSALKVALDVLEKIRTRTDY